MKNGQGQLRPETLTYNALFNFGRRFFRHKKKRWKNILAPPSGLQDLRPAAAF